MFEKPQFSIEPVETGLNYGRYQAEPLEPGPKDEVIEVCGVLPAADPPPAPLPPPQLTVTPPGVVTWPPAPLAPVCPRELEVEPMLIGTTTTAPSPTETVGMSPLATAVSGRLSDGALTAEVVGSCGGT